MIAQVIKVLGLAAAGLVVLASILVLFSGSKLAKKTINLNSSSDTPPVRIEKARDGSDIYLIPDSRLPKTGNDFAEAATLEVVPANWPELPELGLAGDQRRITVAERQQIARAAAQFLRAWENFTPPADRPEAAKLAKSYSRRLAPWVSDKKFPDIIARKDANDDPTVCPYLGCVLGQRFYPIADENEAMALIYYDKNQAFVASAGYVRYFGDENSSLNGALVQRSYGLLLVLNDGRWRVIRAAAGRLKERGGQADEETDSESYP